MRWLTLAGLVYLLSGLYIVGSDEVGVVRLFGKVWQERVESGLHYRPPFPFTRLDKVKVRQVRRVAVGAELPDILVGRQANPLQGEFLTGDQNIITLRATIHYTVHDPVAFLFSAQDPEGLLRRAAEHVLTKTVAQMPVDEVMTSGKIQVQNRCRTLLQRLLDERERLGVTVVAFTLERVAPPEPVKEAFDAVTKARQTRYQRILEAQVYANILLPKARGEAQRIVNDALAYRNRRIAEAKGEAARFLLLLDEYRKAKGVTQTRLYLEALEEILPRWRKVIVDERQGQVDVGMIRRTP